MSNSEVVRSSAMMERNTVYWLHAVNEVPGHRHIQCGEHSMGEAISSFFFLWCLEQTKNSSKVPKEVIFFPSSNEMPAVSNWRQLWSNCDWRWRLQSDESGKASGTLCIIGWFPTPMWSRAPLLPFPLKLVLIPNFWCMYFQTQRLSTYLL